MEITEEDADGTISTRIEKFTERLSVTKGLVFVGQFDDGSGEQIGKDKNGKDKVIKIMQNEPMSGVFVLNLATNLIEPLPGTDLAKLIPYRVKVDPSGRFIYAYMGLFDRSIYKYDGEEVTDQYV
eukprot:403337773